MRVAKVLMMLIVLSVLNTGCETDPNQWAAVGDNEAIMAGRSSTNESLTNMVGVSTNTTSTTNSYFRVLTNGRL